MPYAQKYAECFGIRHLNIVFFRFYCYLCAHVGILYVRIYRGNLMYEILSTYACSVETYCF
jgi:hypothetical protein